MKLPIIFILYSLFNFSLADESKIIINRDNSQIIVQEIQKQLNDPKINDSTKSKLSLKAANEFFNFKLYEEAIYFYSIVLKLNQKADINSSYINIISSKNILKKSSSEILHYLTQFEFFLSKNKEFDNEANRYFISQMRSAHDANANPVKEGFFFEFATDNNIKQKILSKQYKEALELFDRKHIQNSQDPIRLITFDILSKTQDANFNSPFCLNEYLKHKEALSSFNLLCSLLMDKINHKKFNQEQLKKAEKFFNEISPQHAYLLEVIKEIK